MKKNIFKKININKIFYIFFALLHLIIFLTTIFNVLNPNQETIFIVQVSFSISLIQLLLLFLVFQSLKLVNNRKSFLAKIDSHNWYKKHKPEEVQNIIKIILPSLFILQGETAAIINEIIKDTFFAAVYSLLMIVFILMFFFTSMIILVSFKDLKKNYIIKRIIKVIRRVKNNLVSQFKVTNLKIIELENENLYNQEIKNIFFENKNFDLIIINDKKSEILNLEKKYLDFRTFN
ncbi:hypothetical protein [Spiroplasma alleghenense]|uniref:Uncharacterized protein n=1 Tax=Spiroplasma alleghenense TaxID=216931 RepID=A0A345Z2I8_9MOLU|nr:hypothetical protein [Spiroplasma alleghenense]AXK50817.1 hypothetical protein SALLE_v1c01410 [Spiroplasma alleghenense]